MNTYDFVHLTFLALGGEICGKTKLQKVVYFLGLMTGHESDLGYRPHYYGPYSDEVAAAVGRLKTLGFLDQTIAGVGAVDLRGFEVARYDYRLNADGTQVAQAKSGQLAAEWGEIQRATKALAALIEKDYMELSVAAKTYFLLGEQAGHAAQADLVALAPRFGWSVTPAEVQAAAQLLKDVGLDRLT